MGTTRIRGASRPARIVAVAVGLPLIIGGFVATVKETNNRRRTDVFESMSGVAKEEAARLDEYFSRSRDVMLLAANNPALRDFFALPGERADRLARASRTVRDVGGTLAFIAELYNGKIGEICFIDRGGAEIARMTNGAPAPPDELSLDEAENAFFINTVAAAPGVVVQATPYLSPDTGEWVISNSTLVTGPSGASDAVLHFEVSLESFRPLLQTNDDYVSQVFDAATGRVLVDSRERNGSSELMASDREAVFRDLVAELQPAGTIELDGDQISYVRVPTTDGNENQWVVAVSSPAVATGWLSGVRRTTLITFLSAAMLIAVAAIERAVGSASARRCCTDR